MIISEKKAMPIINTLMENAVEEIKEKTGVEIDKGEILLELMDVEWIFGVSIDEEEEYIDLTQAIKQIDYIVARNIKYIEEEQKGE